MPKFISGPAKGEAFTILRAPRFLRITQNGPCFRALDQPGDEPEETELIYVYKLHGPSTEDHALAAQAIYHYLPVQPPDKIIRRTPSWCGWTKQQLQLIRESQNPSPL